MQHHELKLDSNKANLTVEGHRLDNLPVPSISGDSRIKNVGQPLRGQGKS